MLVPVPVIAVVAACLAPPSALSDEAYLYSLYEKAPMVDDSGNFRWKEELAAKKAGVDQMTYAIGFMDERLMHRLARMLRAMEVQGLDPAINTAYRSDFRQSLIKGRGPKAPVGQSYHGGSYVGGPGHGQAADIVSAHATSLNRKEREAADRPLWLWIERCGRDYDLGRPYGEWDAPHVGLIYGHEYLAHRGTTHTHSARRHKTPHRKHKIRHA